MAYIISSVSQKGGVGKSTLARLIAREAAADGLRVKIADLDTQQSTCTNWAARRIQAGIEPEIEVQPIGNITRALREAEQYDVYIFDGAPQASKQSLEIARASDLVILPSSTSKEEREPAVLLANDLFEAGIPAEKIAFALCLVGNSKKKLAQAKSYFNKTQYQLIDGEIPFRDSFETVLEQGRAPTETPFKTLSKRADLLAQNIIDAVVAAKKQAEAAHG